MANFSDCGELHNELWKFSDIDELFARVPLPYDVLNDVPELDDALLATHCAMKSAKVCHAGQQLKDNASAGSLESCFGRPATESQITVSAQKHSQPVNNVLSILHVLFLPSKRSLLCQNVLKVHHKHGNPYFPSTLHLGVGFYVTLVANCT